MKKHFSVIYSFPFYFLSVILLKITITCSVLFIYIVLLIIDHLPHLTRMCFICFTTQIVCVPANEHELLSSQCCWFICAETEEENWHEQLHINPLTRLLKYGGIKGATQIYTLPHCIWCTHTQTHRFTSRDTEDSSFLLLFCAQPQQLQRIMHIVCMPSNIRVLAVAPLHNKYELFLY